MEQERKEEEERRDDLEKQTYTFRCELAPRAGFKKWITPPRGHPVALLLNFAGLENLFC